MGLLRAFAARSRGGRVRRAFAPGRDPAADGGLDARAPRRAATRAAPPFCAAGCCACGDPSCERAWGGA
jgi:hypothetical protein